MTHTWRLHAQSWLPSALLPVQHSLRFSSSRQYTEAPAVLQTDEEGLDASEAFDQLQVSRVYAQDPDSLAFHAAKKQVRSKQTKQSHRSFLAVR